MTSPGALAFIREEDGYVCIGVPVEAEDADHALRRAEALGRACGGAIAYSIDEYDGCMEKWRVYGRSGRD